MVNQLKELVSKGIEGGIIKLRFHKARFLGVVHVSPEEYFVRIEYLDGLFRRTAKPTVPDLINDDDFMKSVYGEEPECTECGIRKCLFEDEEQQCPWTLPRYKLIQQQAIILSGDAQVKCLHKMMKEVKNGM